jgi:eukaryotic-like serine/threonine-protein kinase
MIVLASRYELLEQVGEGGMGVVWRAHDEKLERTVAIKLLRSFVAEEPEQRRRFDREARTLAGLTNDHVVRVYDYVDAGEQAFLVMEYIEGGNLAETTFGRLPLPVPEAAAYAAPVARALAYAHGKGVVHRDLTPANILIERETGRVVTTDFGLARIARSAGSVTAAGVLIGTPEYWSPEQALGRETGVAADLYALGCILFLLLSGRPPFEGDDRLAVGLRRAHEDAPPLRTHVTDAPAAAAALVDALLAREPARRPAAPDAVAVLTALARGRGIEPATVALAAARPTVALTPEQPTALLRRPAPPTLATVAHGRERVPPPQVRRYGPRRLAASFLAAAAATAGTLLLVRELRQPALRAPNVLALRESAARAQIRHTLPQATVAVHRVYSTTIASGRVIRQRPRPREPLGNDARVTLTVSKGTPFAAVPLVAAGEPATRAKASLERVGFDGRFRYTPSWTIRKGTVIELRPRVGTRLRRPATVKIVVASGYPRAVVPNVVNAGLATAQSQLESKHLRYHVVYRLDRTVPSNQVLGQIPGAGATVYSGTHVRLVVSRTLRWTKVLARSGSDAFVSDPFSVPQRWRIRYRLDAGYFAPPLAQVTWSPEGGLPGGGNFVANTAGDLQTYAVTDGPGTYRLSVNPFVGTSWYVEVDALR